MTFVCVSIRAIHNMVPETDVPTCREEMEKQGRVLRGKLTIYVSVGL